MGIVVLGAVFVDIKGYPLATYIPEGRNAGVVKHVHGGVSRNIVEDSANVKTFYRENGHFRLQPENRTMKPIIVDEVYILGKVVADLRFY